MTLDDIKHRYASAAQEHIAATERGDHETANRAHDVVIECLRLLRQTNDRGQRVLVELLSSPQAGVRAWVATHLLPLEPAIAVQALEELSKLPGAVGFDAETVLKEWRKGTLEIP